MYTNPWIVPVDTPTSQQASRGPRTSPNPNAAHPVSDFIRPPSTRNPVDSGARLTGALRSGGNIMLSPPPLAPQPATSHMPNYVRTPRAKSSVSTEANRRILPRRQQGSLHTTVSPSPRLTLSRFPKLVAVSTPDAVVTFRGYRPGLLHW